MATLTMPLLSLLNLAFPPAVDGDTPETKEDKDQEVNNNSYNDCMQSRDVTNA